MRTPDYLPENQCWKKRALVPEVIIIHFISASRDYPDDPYNYTHVVDILEHGGFSAHEGILRNGDIKEWVPIEYQAWHVGASSFREYAGRNLNKYAIGIEVFGQYDDDFTDEQYESLANTVNYHMQKYNIPSWKVKGHEDVSGPKVRSDYKVDPGPRFDWLRLGMLIEKRNIGMT